MAVRLWDSWADDALVLDRAGVYGDPEKLQQLDHVGDHFRVEGPLTVPRPPQGRPVLLANSVAHNAPCDVYIANTYDAD